MPENNFSKMRVFKFGGASVKDAQGVRRLAQIVQSQPLPLVVVVSAMGKTTNALERLVAEYWRHKSDFSDLFNQIKKYHFDIVKDLFESNHRVYVVLNELFTQLYNRLHQHPSMNYDYEYDQIVSFGELFSTIIVSEYLDKIGLPVSWLDVRNLIKTDNKFRDASVNWDLTLYKIHSTDFSEKQIYVTQGFIASNFSGQTTTLGREGSDFTGAILAWALGAESLTVWKDVSGIYNADPKLFSDAQKYERLSYQEAIELAFYGAKVIHPKTIKPLFDKKIPLFVRSFNNPDELGTLIADFEQGMEPRIPAIIVKPNQVLITLSYRNFNFITESSLQVIFTILEKFNFKINVMQRTALKLSLAVDYDPIETETLLNELQVYFQVKYNVGLTLYTFRHYDEQTIKKTIAGKRVYLHQQSRVMSFYLVKD